MNDDLDAAAKAAGATMSRSAFENVTHWVRIGKESRLLAACRNATTPMCSPAAATTTG